MRLTAGGNHEIRRRDCLGVDAIGHAQHTGRKEALGGDARAEPPSRHDPFALDLNARHLDRPDPFKRRDHALRQVIMAGPRISEEDDFKRGHVLFRLEGQLAAIGLKRHSATRGGPSKARFLECPSAAFAKGLRLGTIGGR